ncbi:MAG TPA: serine hydrolase domain-containing protein [Acidobacteriota bacterium]|nr:serine hydrolase domain-containing protein [Acidobacteriota bacterium]
MLKKVGFVVVLLVAFSVAAMTGACGGPPAEESPMDAAGLINGEIGERIDAYMKGLEGIGFCGAVLVARGEEVLVNKGYGYADIGKGIRNTAETVFLIGSITKQFTAAAIMKLEMEGKLNTADSISKYLESVPEDKQEITLHQVLTHTAGFVDYTGDDYETTPRDEAVRRALAAMLLFTPGEQFQYSNAGFSVLAAIVEIVSGKPYEDFVLENLFKPAGMKHTGYRGPDWSGMVISRMYNDDTDNGTALERDYPYWNLLGNGGVMSTTYDMFLWHRALMGESVLSAEAKEKLYTPELNNYAYGWDSRETEFGRLITHDGGNDLGANSNFMRYIDRDVVVFYASNRRISGFPTNYLMRNALVRIALGEDFDPFPAAAEGEGYDPAAFAGRFLLDSGEFIDANVLGGRLVLVPVGQEMVNAIIAPPEDIASECSEINEKAVRVIDAIAAGDFDPLGGLMVNPERLEGWKEFLTPRIADLGDIEEYLVLGTIQAWWSPGEGLVSFIRIKGANKTLVFRFHWNEQGIWGLGGRAIEQPVTLICQPRGESELAAYEPALGLTIPVGILREGENLSLILKTSSGDITATRQN